jgi:diguanylate cyclase (GGDEF)-like protein
VRAEDLLGRFGGDELVVLSRATNCAAAEQLAERLRVAVCSRDVVSSRGPVNVSVSIGVAELAECSYKDFEHLTALSDGRLYAAKARGRNRVCGRE